MKEIWKDIEGYEGDYQISNTGKVKSTKMKFGKVPTETIMKQTITVWGYKRVCLIKDKRGKNKYIHRLVAEAFIPNEKNYPCVNHIDSNKLNNCVDNLEWCTFKENSNKSTTIKNLHRWNQIAVKDNKGNHFKSYRQAGIFWGINPNTVKRDCLGLTKYSNTQKDTKFERKIRFSLEEESTNEKME